MNSSFVKKIVVCALIAVIATGSSMIQCTQGAPSVITSTAMPQNTTTTSKSPSLRTGKIVKAGLFALAGLGFVDGAYNFYNCSPQAKATALLTCLGTSAFIYGFVRRPELSASANMKLLKEHFIVPVGVLLFINGIRVIASTTCTEATKMYKKMTEDSVAEDYDDEDDGETVDPSPVNHVFVPEVTTESPVEINETIQTNAVQVASAVQATEVAIPSPAPAVVVAQ